MNISIIKIKIILISIIIVTTSISIYFSADYKNKKKIPEIDTNKMYKVINVIDGDTFEIKVGQQTFVIRMLGIDTPETVDPRKPMQCFGKESSDKTRELLVDRGIIIRFDPTQDYVDKYDRLLGYITRDDQLFVNRYLIETGFAREYTYYRPYKHQKEFKKIEKTARDMKLGLWSSCLQE